MSDMFFVSCSTTPFVPAMDEPPPKKRRTGGVRQRVAATAREEAVANPPPVSDLAASPLEKWAWGQLSPQEVQEFAANSCKDFDKIGAVPPGDLKFYSSLGSHGSFKPFGFCFLSKFLCFPQFI